MNSKQITSLSIIVAMMLVSIHASLKLAMTISTAWLHIALVWLSLTWIIYLGIFAICRFHSLLKTKSGKRTHFEFEKNAEHSNRPTITANENDK